MHTRVREWETVDYYAVLGVDRRATGDEIARAFRARAKQLHPDAAPAPESAGEFHDLTAAYTVLSNHRTRREYDELRAGIARTVVPVSVSRPAPAKPTRWTRRRALTAFIGGTLVAILGCATAFITWDLHESDAARHARYVPVLATRIDDGRIMFFTRDKTFVNTKEPTQRGEGSSAGLTVKVRYDPADPHRVIVDGNTLGRDITLGIVALKLIVGGVVFAVLGWRRLRSV